MSEPTCPTCANTGYKPKPEGWDQMAHLRAPDRTCECHDSWDQCPCAESGHFPGCNCCPGGTGLCGPLPCDDPWHWTTGELPQPWRKGAHR
jgi:hypothetical protein